MNQQQLFIKPDHIVTGHNLLFTNGVSKVGGGQTKFKMGAKIQKHTCRMSPDRNCLYILYAYNLIINAAIYYTGIAEIEAAKIISPEPKKT